MFQVNVVEKKIENKKILSNISFEIKTGEFISIFGKSGCGKSTLLRIIMGLDKEFEGELVIPQNDLAISIMFQEDTLLKSMTVSKNIEFALPSTIIKEEKKSKILNILEDLSLKEISELYPKQISGGMAQRVSLARAIINHPELLLLDEPLASLDTLTKWEVRSFIEKIIQEYKSSTIMVTHDIEDALYLSDRIIVLANQPATITKVFNNNVKGRDLFCPDFQKAYLELKKEIFDEK